MITHYYRPRTLEEALKLLSQPQTLALGGGTRLTQPADNSFAVVDLQALGLNKLRKNGDNLEMGAAVTLQDLLEFYLYTPCLKTRHRVGDSSQPAQSGNIGRDTRDL